MYGISDLFTQENINLLTNFILNNKDLCLISNKEDWKGLFNKLYSDYYLGELFDEEKEEITRLRSSFGFLYHYFLKLDNFDILQVLDNIPDYAFYEDYALDNVEIPKNITSIGDGAFAGCHELTSVKIPKTVIKIGRCAFSECSSLTTISVEDGNPIYHSAENCLIETATQTLMKCCVGGGFPESVIHIGEEAFSDNLPLASFAIPDGVLDIGKKAFFGCAHLSSIRLPASLKRIEEGAFSKCHELTSIIIPSSVKSIQDQAFYGCSDLASVIVFGSETRIGDRAFACCPCLTDIYFSNDACIGNNSFGQHPQVVIHAPRGSVAEFYAKEHNILFETI